MSVSNGFKSPLIVKHVARGWHRLELPLLYRYEDWLIYAPAGFVTDFASVPRIPGVYWAWGARAAPSAVVHDMLYRFGLRSRKFADKVFLDAMKHEGKSIWIRYPMYSAVRAFGRQAYNSAPGCLDYRDVPCEHYYPQWENCVRRLN